LALRKLTEATQSTKTPLRNSSKVSGNRPVRRNALSGIHFIAYGFRTVPKEFSDSVNNVSPRPSSGDSLSELIAVKRCCREYRNGNSGLRTR
jgi:hypothetical protein